MNQPVTAILLAAQRAGMVNPLAARAGVSHKCLVPICGRPLIEHVLDTLTAIEGIHEIRVSLEPEAHEAVLAIYTPFASRGVPLTLFPSSTNLVDSVMSAAEGGAGPFLITTADNVLLTADGVEQIRSAMTQADAVIAISTRERVLAAHPEGQRNFYELRGKGYANCNLYGLANRKALTAAEAFREGGQFQANPGRMVRAFGLLNILRMRFGLTDLQSGLARVGKRFGVRLAPVVFEDGSLAIDVDNERTYDCCETILRQRGMCSV